MDAKNMTPIGRLPRIEDPSWKQDGPDPGHPSHRTICAVCCWRWAEVLMAGGPMCRVCAAASHGWPAGMLPPGVRIAGGEPPDAPLTVGPAPRGDSHARLVAEVTRLRDCLRYAESQAHWLAGHARDAGLDLAGALEELSEACREAWQG